MMRRQVMKVNNPEENSNSSGHENLDAEQQSESRDEKYIEESNVDVEEMAESEHENSVLAESVTAQTNLAETLALFPALSILKYGQTGNEDEEYIRMQGQIIDGVFAEFNISAKVVEWQKGSRVVQFNIETGRGVRVDSIERYRDNFKLRLGVDRIQILAPIPGKNAVGIQVPRKTPDIVSLRDVLEKFESELVKGRGGKNEN